MPQSLCKLYAHLIFSTKDRIRFLDQTIRDRVHGFMATTMREMEVPFVVVGGTDDHVHILFDTGKKHAPPDFPAIVKKESSKFIKTLARDFDKFAWQRGYAMFSVGPLRVQQVEQYIRSQEEHHRKMSFQEEFRAFLDKYQMPYNEEYVWG
jgi:putative transposase